MNVSKHRVLSLRNREADLNERITKLDTEEGIEQEIRSKFSVIKDNENMVVIVPSKMVATTTVNKESGFWTKIISFFK